MKDRMKQWLKAFVQSVLLPRVYHRYRKVPIRKNLVLLADAHNDALPFSLQGVAQEAAKRGYEIEYFLMDYSAAGLFAVIKQMLRFMRQYAQARCVFLCDSFLPASSCVKKEETGLVQLWHACGVLKKFGYAAPDKTPISAQATAHYTLVPVSAPAGVPFYAQAFHVAEEIVQPIGVSRTDFYFAQDYLESCRTAFYAAYPQMEHKKLLLWAPTFHGRASDPDAFSFEVPELLQRELGDEWRIIVKLHPYAQKKFHLDNCSFPTQTLFPVADVLLTDYSSILFEYALLEKPWLLFAPDLEKYEKTRGFYVNIREEFPCIVELDAEKLAGAVLKACREFCPDANKLFLEKYMSACDGNATSRILDAAGLETITEKSDELMA